MTALVKRRLRSDTLGNLLLLVLISTVPQVSWAGHLGGFQHLYHDRIGKKEIAAIFPTNRAKKPGRSRQWTRIIGRLVGSGDDHPGSRVIGWPG